MSFTGIGEVSSLIGNVIDKIWPDKSDADKVKLRLFEIQENGQLQELMERYSVIKTEAASTHWLAANWRPLLMLVFGFLIVCRWFGFTAPNLSEAEYLKLWDIVELGLGGYVIGRSAEKVLPAIVGALKK